MPSDPGEQPDGPPSLRLYAERHGAGEPTLVFVHGFCCNGSDWEHQVRRFMPSHQVLVPDLRGHGWSPAFGECTEHASGRSSGPGADRRGGGNPWLELLREHVRQVSVEIITGAGHFSMIERPTAVNEAVEKFISSLLV